MCWWPQHQLFWFIMPSDLFMVSCWRGDSAFLPMKYKKRTRKHTGKYEILLRKVQAAASPACSCSVQLRENTDSAKGLLKCPWEPQYFSRTICCLYVKCRHGAKSQGPSTSLWSLIQAALWTSYMLERYCNFFIVSRFSLSLYSSTSESVISLSNLDMCNILKTCYVFNAFYFTALFLKTHCWNLKWSSLELSVQRNADFLVCSQAG